MPGRRPYVLLKCAMSVDGFLDDSSGKRLLLSSAEDLARVDVLRADVDAILVGATTIRKDNPRLMVQSDELRQQRRDRGQPETPTKVALTLTGDLSPELPFFTTGDCEKIVYTAASGLDVVKGRLGAVATIVAVEDPILPGLLADLHTRGVGRLMVEGGNTVHTQFLVENLVDELKIAVAPFFVGDADAPRFVGAGRFPFSSTNRMILAEVAQYGDCALLRYLLPSHKLATRHA